MELSHHRWRWRSTTSIFILMRSLLFPDVLLLQSVLEMEICAIIDPDEVDQHQSYLSVIPKLQYREFKERISRSFDDEVVWHRVQVELAWGITISNHFLT